MVQSCFILFFRFLCFSMEKMYQALMQCYVIFPLVKFCPKYFAGRFIFIFFCSVQKCSDTRSLVFDIDHKNCIDPSSFAGYCTMCEKDLYIHVCCIHIFISKSNCIYRYKVYSFASLCFKLFV